MARLLRLRLLNSWHSHLSLPQYVATNPQWYRSRLREELAELRSARTTLEKLSESADVLYILSRAKHDGCRGAVVGANRSALKKFVDGKAGVYGYMVLKYTLRWGFYRVLARLTTEKGKAMKVREVVNPRKDSKLAVVAERHGIEGERFKAWGRRLRWIWPLLP